MSTNDQKSDTPTDQAPNFERPGPYAIEDVPAQVLEDETDWVCEVRDQHVRRHNPDLTEAMKRLSELAKQKLKDRG